MGAKKVAEIEAEYQAVKSKSSSLNCSVGLIDIASITTGTGYYYYGENYECCESYTIYYYKGTNYDTDWGAANSARNSEIYINIDRLSSRIGEVDNAKAKLEKVKSDCNRSLIELHKDKTSLKSAIDSIKGIQGTISSARSSFNAANESCRAAIGCTPDGSIAEASQGFEFLNQFISKTHDTDKLSNGLTKLIEQDNKIMTGASQEGTRLENVIQDLLRKRQAEYGKLG